MQKFSLKAGFAVGLALSSVSCTAAAEEDKSSGQQATSITEPVFEPISTPDLVAAMAECVTATKSGAKSGEGTFVASGWNKVGTGPNKYTGGATNSSEVILTKGNANLFLLNFAGGQVQACRLIAQISDRAQGDAIFAEAINEFNVSRLTPKSSFSLRNPNVPESEARSFLENNETLIRIKVEDNPDDGDSDVMISIVIAQNL